MTTRQRSKENMQQLNKLIKPINEKLGTKIEFNSFIYMNHSGNDLCFCNIYDKQSKKKFRISSDQWLRDINNNINSLEEKVIVNFIENN